MASDPSKLGAREWPLDRRGKQVARENREVGPFLRQGERVAFGAQKCEERARPFEAQGKPFETQDEPFGGRASPSELGVNPSRLRARRWEW